MSSWSSYPSSFGIGHRVLKGLFEIDLNCEEKVDGSQFSFGLVESNTDDAGNVVDPVYSIINGVSYSLKVRSKGAVMVIDAPESLFREACETVKTLAANGLLHPGWTYRGECLKKPKHNSLAYDRVPTGHVIIFDVSTGDQEYLSYEDKVVEAARLGLECVPLLFSGRIADASEIRKFLDTTSILGGQKIEGVVLKPKDYLLFGPDHKLLMGKFVSEAFKETHRQAWGESNPTNKDILQKIGDTLTTQARWAKALLHLKEAGKITGTVQDIGLIIREVPDDILKEEEEWIRETLFKHSWPHIRRIVTRGLAEWYKDQLMRSAFEEDSIEVLLNQAEEVGDDLGQSPRSSTTPSDPSV